MFLWFQALMPREERFFQLFTEHARVLVKGAETLQKLLIGGQNIAAFARQVSLYEQEADNIEHEILRLTRRTLITPFDRSDIKGIVGSLDDTIDQMQKTAKAIILFEVDKLEPEMAQMGDCIVKAAQLTVEAVELLGSMRQEASRLSAIGEQIVRLEEQTDTINDRGIKALYLRHRGGDAMEYVTRVEIYDHLEKVMDRFEDVADAIGDLLLEQI